MSLSIYLFILKKLSPTKWMKAIGVKCGDNCRLIGNNSFGSEPYLISIVNHVSMTIVTFITHDGGVWVFRSEYPDFDVVKPIKIGNNAFIGHGVTILLGSVIQDNVVIGAGSLVRGVLQANAVYAGVPVRMIKGLSEYLAGALNVGSMCKRMRKDDKMRYFQGLFK